MQKISIYLFNKHIADMHQDEDRVYLKQIDDLCYKASPLMISKDIEYIDTTTLSFQSQVAGFISDSLPGSFGDDILNEFFLKESNRYPTVSDKLLFISDKGLGALVFKPSMHKDNEIQQSIELKKLFEESKKLKRGSSYHVLQDSFLVAAHSFVGGARSKAVVLVNLQTKMVLVGNKNKASEPGYIHAIIKYDDTANDDENKSTYSKIEYIYYLIAKEAGIQMNDCFLLETNKKHHFITKRFDIEADGKRYHVHSLAGLLHKDYNQARELGYEDLLRTAVRLGATNSLRQLFSQMLFNYMFVNQDDHCRNFSFMCDEDFKWKATPAYDLTFAKGRKQTVEHQLSLYGKALSKIDIDDIVQLSTEFSIDLSFVEKEISILKYLREKKLPELLNKYKIDRNKKEQILFEVNNRTFQGALDE